MLHILRSRARHGLRALSVSTYLLTSPALAHTLVGAPADDAGGHETADIVVPVQARRR